MIVDIGIGGFPVHQIYNLKRLEILEMEIDNQLRAEGYGEG